MTQRRKKNSSAGIGQCGTPDCQKPKAPGRYLCDEHAEIIGRIRKELEEDPRLLYHQRSASEKRVIMENGEIKRRPAPRVPTCCFVGCYEIRVPPSRFCDAHEEVGHQD